MNVTHGGNVWQGEGPEKWLDYSANIRPGGAPEWVKQALLAGMDSISYYPDRSMRVSRESLAEYLNLPSEYVLPTAGGISAIDMATHIGTDNVLLCAPCFGEYRQLISNRGLPVSEISLIKSPHVLGEPAEMAAGKLTRGCVVWLCNPMNPVGKAHTPAQITALLAKLEKADGWLVVDEAFIEYCPEHSVASLIKSHERIICTGSMTKILGIPGVRLGYICAQPHVLEKLRRYQLTWEISSFAEAVLRELPRHTADIAREAALNAGRRQQLREALMGLGMYVYPSEASFLLTDTVADAAALADNLHKKGILVRQCLDFTGIDEGRHLRLAVKDEASNEKLLSALREVYKCAENR